MKNYVLLLLTGNLLCNIAPNTVVGTVQDASPATFNQPFPLAVTPNGLSMYVGNFFFYTSVSLVDIATNRVSGTVNDPGMTFFGPDSITITPDGTTVYVANDTPSTVSYINVATNTAALVDDPGMTFSNPLAVTVIPGGLKAYVVNSVGNSISIIDVAHNIVSSPAITDASLNSPSCIAVTPDGSTAYVGNFGNNSVVSVDVLSDTVTGPVPTNGFPFGRPTSIAITPDGRKAYVANNTLNTINIIDVEAHIVTGTVHDPHALISGKGPQECAVTPNGKTLYVTTDANTVVVVDVATDTATELVADPDSTFNGLFGIAITPDGSTGYVSNFNARSVSIIAIAPAPPQTVIGCRSQNSFLMQKDLINKITWQAPTTGTTPVSYQIYRDAGLTDLVATVPASGLLEYLDHNRSPYVVYEYFIVAVDQNGTMSTPVSITVTQPC